MTSRCHCRQCVQKLGSSFLIVFRLSVTVEAKTEKGHDRGVSSLGKGAQRTSCITSHRGICISEQALDCPQHLGLAPSCHTSEALRGGASHLRVPIREQPQDCPDNQAVVAGAHGSQGGQSVRSSGAGLGVAEQQRQGHGGPSVARRAQRTCSSCSRPPHIGVCICQQPQRGIRRRGVASVDQRGQALRGGLAHVLVRILDPLEQQVNSGLVAVDCAPGQGLHGGAPQVAVFVLERRQQQRDRERHGRRPG
mmetsp:Transcript_119588/g.381592  ORF Transcript_119588/g.381592 Transcript_119588/m.381592 type:complete len:251 (+) Transcript_119588:2027-2779(+)